MLTASSCGALPVMFGGHWCREQAIIASYFGCASFLWSTVIALYLWLIVSVREKAAKALLRYAGFVAWGYPLVMSIVLAKFASLGVTNEPWCFIRRDTPHSTLLRVLSVYGPLWLSLLVSGGAYVAVVRSMRVLHMHNRASFTMRELAEPSVRERRQQLLEMERKLLFIPVVFVVLRVWGSANRVYTMATGGKPAELMSELQAACDPLQGFANGILFGVLTAKVRKAYADCCCCRRGDVAYDHEQLAVAGRHTVISQGIGENSQLLPGEDAGAPSYEGEQGRRGH